MRTVATVIQLDVTRVWFRAGIILKTTLELLLVALLLLSTISRAESQTTNIQDHTTHIRPLHLFPETEIYHGSVSMVFQEDKSASITLEQILTPEYQKKFSRLHGNQASFSHTDSAYWLQIPLTNMSADEMVWNLIINYPLLDDITVYFITPNQTKKYTGGDKYPFSLREIALPNFVFPLRFDGSQTATVYIRVQSSGSLNVPFSLVQNHKLIEKSSTQSFYYGIYYGALFILILYNLLVYSSTRINSFFFNAYYMLSIMLFMLSMSGYAYQYLWPQYPSWSNMSIPILEANGMLAILLFGRSFLQDSSKKMGFDRTFIFFIALSLIAFLLAITIKYAIAVKVNTALAVVSIMFVYWVGIVRFRQGISAAKTFILAWSILLVSTFIYSLGAFAVIPDYYANEVVMLTGTTAQIIFLNFALAQQTKDMSSQLIDFEKSARERLQQQVNERTAQLTEANVKLATLNKKLEELSTRDDLTQVANRRFFNQMLDQQYAIARRDNESLSLLFLDIDHFKKLNDKLGHQAGDDCLKFVSDIINGCLHRPKDFLARYGGEEFAIILPDTDQEGAEKIALTILNEVRKHPFFFNGTPYPMTVSIGVYSNIPNQFIQQADYLSRADTAMYEAKQNGRNQVRTFQS